MAMRKGKSGKTALPAVGTLTVADVVSRRWATGLPQSSDYYYDEPTRNLTKKSSDGQFPPEGMDLSDTWVVAVVRSGLSGDDRSERWPIVFTRLVRCTLHSEHLLHYVEFALTASVRVFGISRHELQ